MLISGSITLGIVKAVNHVSKVFVSKFYGILCNDIFDFIIVIVKYSVNILSTIRLLDIQVPLMNSNYFDFPYKVSISVWFLHSQLYFLLKC